MAGNTFYTKGRQKSSKASASHRSLKGANDLPGLSYAQGHSIRDIFVPRGLIPVIGREGYKTIRNTRITDGSANNRTIVATQDAQSNNYFLDSDGIELTKFFVDRDGIVTITKENYANNITHVLFPNGDSQQLESFDIGIINDLISFIVDNGINFYDSIKIPQNLVGASAFRGYTKINFRFTTDSVKAKVVFPDGGITQVPNFGHVSRVYGEDGDYLKTTPYTDLRKFDPVQWVQESGPPGMYPDVTPSRSYQGTLFNGIIEPFNIRTEIYDLDTFAKTDEVKPNSLNGKVMTRVNTFSILSENLNIGTSHYEDNGDGKTGTSLLETQFITPDSFIPDPFKEREPYGNIYLDNEILSIFSASFLDPGIMHDGIIAACTGFIEASGNKIDSIVYRGRLR